MNGWRRPYSLDLTTAFAVPALAVAAIAAFLVLAFAYASMPAFAAALARIRGAE